MKKIQNAASIVLALVMALAIVAVPVFAVANTPFANVSANNAANVENEIVGDIANDNSEIVETSEVPTISNDDVHVCPITKANERRHIVDCDECGNYQNVRHSELEKVTVNGFFHIQSCVCGYTYTEQHDFDTAFNADYHYDVCVDCGYVAPAEEHTLCDVFDGNEHYIECDSCGYMAERHIGVTYETVDEGCFAMCRGCDTSEIVEHDWSGFICSNCDYEMSGKTAGIIERIWRSEEGYTVRIDVNGTDHIIDLYDENFNEGDCVVVNHSGNHIWDVRVVVEYEICDDPDNLSDYVTEGIKGNTVDELEFYDDGTAIIDFVDGSFLYVENAIVYDFENGNAVDIQWVCEDERIVWFYVDDQLVILDYYW